MPTRKVWDHAVELKEGFVPRKGGGEGVHKETVKEGLHLTVEITTDSTGILCGKERWKKVDGTRLLISE